VKIVLSVVTVLIVAAAGFYGFYQSKPAPIAEPSLQKQFEEALTGFLQDVHAKTVKYKETRRILPELIAPDNINTPEYLQENTQMLDKTVADLQGEMADILGTFQAMEEKVKGLLEGQPENKRAVIFKSWQEMKRKQSEKFIAYFSAEQDRLKAYQDVMKFYATKQGGYKYDPQTHLFVFANPADAAEEKKLLNKITK
jgi:hypothetical protein